MKALIALLLLLQIGTASAVTIQQEPQNTSPLSGADLLLLYSQANFPNTVNNTLSQIYGFMNTLPLSTQTASYTAALTDQGTRVRMNASSAVNFTIPPNSSVAFPVGISIVISQEGSGQVTLVPGAGVTLHTPATLATRTQYSQIQVQQDSVNVWEVSGDLQ